MNPLYYYGAKMKRNRRIKM